METSTPKKKISLWIKIPIAIILVIIATLLYARYIATSGLKVHEYLIVDESLPDSFYGLKIAHISDIHYGQTTHKKQLERLVKKVNEYKPDIIVITGDLLDQNVEYSDKDIKDIQNSLNKFEAKFGKYIIMGNHDNIQTIYKELVQNTNFIDLDDAYQILYYEDLTPIQIAGMSTGENWVENPEQKVHDAIAAKQTMDIPYSILIMHEPDYIDEFEYNHFNLILAGHTHNGQVRLPLIGPLILPPHGKKYSNSYYDLGETQLYISNGIGTSNMRVRLFNRPSINLYRIVNK